MSNKTRASGIVKTESGNTVSKKAMNINKKNQNIKSIKAKKTFKISDCDESDLPLVSIIMPVYNAEKFLKNSLRSLTNQTYKKLEIICINDGSTDNSLEILNHIAKNDSRIRVITQENSGPAHARNVGLDNAHGKYISFVDADDSTDMWMYYSLVEYAENEDADILVFGGTPFPDNAPDWIWEKLSPRYIVYDAQKDEYAGTNALFREKSSRPFIWLHFIKRDIIEQSPKLRMNENMDLGEDQLFQFMYFPRAKKVIFWDKRFYFYRWFNEGSLMWTYNNKRVTKFKKHLQIVSNVFSSWNNAGYKDPYGDVVSWMVDFLYNDLTAFPHFLQVSFAKQIMEICEKNDQHIFMCNEYVIENGRKIESLSKEETENFDELMYIKTISYNEQIQNLENEIQARLNSKSFKLGRFLTPKKERLDIKTVLPPVKKKN